MVANDDGERKRRLQAELDEQLLITGKEYLSKAVDFIEFDKNFNAQLLGLMEVFVGAVRSNPSVLFRAGSKVDLESIIAELESRSQSRPNAPGADDVSGEDWIEDVGRFIHALTGIVGEEKKFFLAVIILFKCGCDHLGDVAELVKAL